MFTVNGFTPASVSLHKNPPQTTILGDLRPRVYHHFAEPQGRLLLFEFPAVIHRP